MKALQVKNHLAKVVKFWTPLGLLALYQQRRYNAPPPFPDVPLQLPVRELSDLFTGIRDVQITLTVSQIPLTEGMVLPLRELVTVAAICKYVNPSTVFEIGTYTGMTTRLMAEHTSDSTHIYTLDLPPGQGLPSATLGREFHTGTSAGKITQLWGNSETFEFSPYFGQMDLVFVDGSHKYRFVQADSETAFNLLSPRGTIIWDDYVWNYKDIDGADVARYLNRFASTGECFQIAGTRLAIYIRSGEMSAPRAD